MEYKYDLSVVTATYNEKENISNLISEINKAFKNSRINGQIVVVDDSSPDKTGAIVSGLMKKNSNLVLVTRPPKSGIGSAYGDGIKKSSGRIVITMDADFSHPPRVIGELYSLANRGYIVSGSRFMKSKSFDTKFYRKIGTGLLNTWLKALFRLSIKDHTNGYLAIERNKLDRIMNVSSKLGFNPFDKVLYGIPIFVLGNKMGYRLGQVDAPYAFRKLGETKINFVRGLGLVFGDMIYSAGLFFRLFSNKRRIRAMSNEVKSFYDSCWTDNKSAEDEESHLILRKRAVDYSISLLGNIRNKKFLEIGIGSGKQAEHFAKKEALYTGLDLSESSVSRVSSYFRKKGLKGEITAGNCEKLDFKDGTFDRVYFNSLIMHTDHKKTFKEIFRVLKKGGSLVFIEPITSNPFIWLYRTFFSKYGALNLNYLKYDEIIRYSRLFRKSSHKEFYLLTAAFLPLFFAFRKKRSYVSLVNFFENFDRILIRIFPPLKRLCWVSAVKFVK